MTNRWIFWSQKVADFHGAFQANCRACKWRNASEIPKDNTAVFTYTRSCISIVFYCYCHITIRDRIEYQVITPTLEPLHFLNVVKLILQSSLRLVDMQPRSLVTAHKIRMQFATSLLWWFSAIMPLEMDTRRMKTVEWLDLGVGGTAPMPYAI